VKTCCPSSCTALFLSVVDLASPEVLCSKVQQSKDLQSTIQVVPTENTDPANNVPGVLALRVAGQSIDGVDNDDQDSISAGSWKKRCYIVVSFSGLRKMGRFVFMEWRRKDFSRVSWNKILSDYKIEGKKIPHCRPFKRWGISAFPYCCASSSVLYLIPRVPWHLRPTVAIRVWKAVQGVHL